MIRPPDNPQSSPDQADAAEPELSSNAAADGQPATAAAPIHGTGKAGWAAVGLGLIPAVLTAGFVAVMIFAFTGLGDRINSLENRVTSLENRLANLETRVAGLENRLANLETRVAGLEDRMADLENRMAGLEDRMASLENRMASLENRMIAFERRVEARFAAQDDKIDALDDKIDALDDKIDEINLKLTALIAALGKTDEVDAAAAGELVASAQPGPNSGASPPEPP